VGNAGALQFSALETARDTGKGRSRWALRIPGTLRLLALVAFIVALARPQTGVTSESILTQGIDIVLAMDVSSSMLAEDLGPNRLEAAKDRPGGLRRRSLHTGASDAGPRSNRGSPG